MTMHTSELPPDASLWRRYACKTEITEAGGYCIHIYRREDDGEQWVHTQLGCATLKELNTQLAAVLDQIHRLGMEAGKNEIRAALGLTPIKKPAGF